MTTQTTAGERIGAGGEAEVFAVPGRRDVVMKRYRRPTPERAAKLRVMLDHPPAEASGDQVVIAWPRELVCGANGAVEGFLMPRVDVRSTAPLFQVYNPASRTQLASGFTWRYLLRAARNIAVIVDSLHRAGYVVGDLNESNLLISRRAIVALVDCDSMQVRDPATGEVHRCLVAKPEFLAPEFGGRDLSAVDRTEPGDRFALAVLVFLLLMEGVHPYASVWKGRGDPPDLASRMRARRFPHTWWTPVRPPPAAPPIDVLPYRLRRLTRRCFGAGAVVPALRPSAAAWASALDRVERSVRICARSSHHVYARRRCPWCARVDAGFPDAFPGPSGGVIPRALSKRVRARRHMARSASWLFARAPITAAFALGWLGRNLRRVGETSAVRVIAPAALVIGAAGVRWPVTMCALAVVLPPFALTALSTPRPGLALWTFRLGLRRWVWWLAPAAAASLAIAFYRSPALAAALGAPTAALLAPWRVAIWQRGRVRLLDWARRRWPTRGMATLGAVAALDLVLRRVL